jgi:hypothetical protein
MILNQFLKKAFLLSDDIKNNRIKTIYYIAKNKNLNKIYKEELKKIEKFLNNDEQTIKHYTDDFINNFCLFIDKDYSDIVYNTFKTPEFQKSLERDVKFFNKLISSLENVNLNSYEDFINTFFDYESEFKTFFKIPEKMLDYYCLTSFLFKILSDVDSLTIFNKLGISKQLKEIFGNKYVNVSNLSFYIFHDNSIFYVSYDPLDFLHASYNKPWSSCYNLNNGSYILSLFFYSLSFNSMIIYEINTNDENNKNIFMFYDNILKNNRFISRKLLANPVINGYEFLIFNYSKQYGNTPSSRYIDLFLKIYKKYERFSNASTDKNVIPLLIGKILQFISNRQEHGQYYDPGDTIFYNNWIKNEIENYNEILDFVKEFDENRPRDIIYKYIKVNEKKIVEFCDLWGYGKNFGMNVNIINRDLFKNKKNNFNILEELGINIEINYKPFNASEHLDVLDIVKD